jgi:hypothetical protein
MLQYSWLGGPEYLKIISKQSLDKALLLNDTDEWRVQANIFINTDVESSQIIGSNTLKLETDKFFNETLYFDIRVI